MNLVEEGFDLAVRIGAPRRNSSDVARRMGATRRVVVAAPATSTAPARRAGREDLAGHRIIACTAVGPADRWRFGPAAAPGEVPLTRPS